MRMPAGEPLRVRNITAFSALSLRDAHGTCMNSVHATEQSTSQRCGRVALRSRMVRRGVQTVGANGTIDNVGAADQRGATNLRHGFKRPARAKRAVR